MYPLRGIFEIEPFLVSPCKGESTLLQILRIVAKPYQRQKR